MQLRIDPEFYNKTAQRALKTLGANHTLGGLVKTGYRVVYENTHAIDREEGIEAGFPFFLQAADISSPYIAAETMICVAPSEWDRYPKGRIVPGEILIEVKGKAEKVAIVPDDFPTNTLVTGTCFKMELDNPLDKHMIVAYLLSRYGQALKDRLKTNLLISYIAKADLYSLPVPNYSDKLKRAISQQFLSAETFQARSKSLYTHAEQFLLEALALGTWQPPEPNAYEATFLEKQEEIVANVHAARDARLRSTYLLEQAKRAVEIAIEQGEEAGLTLLNET